jgi:rubrerythrin
MSNKNIKKSLTPLVRKQILQAQRHEVTEYHIYKRLARNAKNERNRKILNSIADDELRHYKTWMKYSGREVEPSRWNILKYYWLSSVFGLSFGLKLMEDGEKRAQINYKEIGKEIPEAIKISEEENQHEKELLKLIGGKAEI